MGFFCTPATTFLVDLAARIAAAIRPRAASEVYQSAAFSLQNFPLELARQLFAFASQLHHALPRAVDGGDSRPDIVGAPRCASTSAQALPLLLPLHSDRGR